MIFIRFPSRFCMHDVTLFYTIPHTNNHIQRSTWPFRDMTSLLLMMSRRIPENNTTLSTYPAYHGKKRWAASATSFGKCNGYTKISSRMWKLLVASSFAREVVVFVTVLHNFSQIAATKLIPIMFQNKTVKGKNHQYEPSTRMHKLKNCIFICIEDHGI